MIKAFIVDDHSLIREGFRKIIELEKDITIAAEAANASDFFKQFNTISCDIVVLDLNLPDKNGLDVLKEIKSTHPQIPVLILSMYLEDRYAIRTFKAGASGYISKENAAESLIKAIHKIMKGGRYVSPELGEKLAFDIGEADTVLHNNLSDREFQILIMIGAGKPISKIAGLLSLSINTINTYRSRVLEKMKLKTNAEIIHYVIKNKLID